MGLYRRKDSKVWWMCFTFKARQYQKSTGTDDKELANRILKSIEGKIAEGKWFPDSRETMPIYRFAELTEKYFEWASRQKAFLRWKKYLIRQLEKEFGKMNMNEFETYLLEHFQSKCLGTGNKPATVNRLIAVLSHMFTKAVDWNMMDQNVAKSIRVKMLPENNKRLRFLSREECESLIGACDKHLRPIVVTAVNTGMRKSEILSLCWNKHIDLKHGFILLDRTKNGERREIPINVTLREVLQGLTRRLDVPYVFFDQGTGKPFQDVKKSFASACRRAGIRDFHFHDLRHTFAVTPYYGRGGPHNGKRAVRTQRH